MNRHQRRAAAARQRKPIGRAELIRLTLDYLANVAAPTATGATMIAPDGTQSYISADHARAFHGAGKRGGRA